MRAHVLLALLLAAGCGGGSGRPASPEPPAPNAVGYRQLRLQDEARQRPVWVDLWYPADPSAPMKPLRYGLAMGRGARDAEPVSGARPLVVLSHGAGGDGANYAWLTEHLAARGYVVAAINHHGESRTYGQASLDRLAMLRMWKRPADVAFALASLLEHEQWGPLIRPDRIGGIGHSAGGHTMLVLAGADWDATRMGTYCESDAARADRGCEYARDLTPADWAAVGTRPDGPLPTESRLAALFLMEPAMGPSYVEESLRQVTIRVQLVASRPGDFLPYPSHAARVAALLPNASLTTLDGGEGHFAFLAECDLPIEVLGLPLCSDAPGVERGALHRRLEESAAALFDHTLEP